MATESGREGDLVLAPGEQAFILDTTKGLIGVLTGPNKISLSQTDTPVVYNSKSERFEKTSRENAIQAVPSASEGYYIVLINPAPTGGKEHPQNGTSSSMVDLEYGRRINIPGPANFPLWPRQAAEVIPGHHLRSNQYLRVRVYNDVEAKKNWKSAVVVPPSKPLLKTEGDTPSLETVPAQTVSVVPPELTMGQVLVIKGTDVSFYIPPTGVEVVPASENSSSKVYVRDAVTLERLEYCILLAENGNKRYVLGPDVVFPNPTESFVQGLNGTYKFRAIELNDDMGLYIKVTADYEEEGIKHVAGEELFITGKETRIYYPRPEHSIIKYGEREVHYGVAIPDGEARYVLDKLTGDVKLVAGPCIFLPDPRKEVIVRRVLSDDEVGLWFPGNEAALAYNRSLRQTLKGNSLEESISRTAGGREATRGTKSFAPDYAAASFAGDSFNRGDKYSPPRMITLDTKYDGAVAVKVWNGYAVLVSDPKGKQRVEVGPKTVLLGYDESLTVLTLSKGKPKTTDNMERTVYLKVSSNQVSDIVEVVTKDMVKAKVKLSWRVNFEGEDRSKWFAVENYVKSLCDHTRSMLRSVAKKCTIEEMNENYIPIIRDAILGVSPGDGTQRPGRILSENGLRIYDVEILDLVIDDSAVSNLLMRMQQDSVKRALDVVSAERQLSDTSRLEELKRKTAEAVADTEKHAVQLEIERIDRNGGLSDKRNEATKKSKDEEAKLVKLTQVIEDSIAKANLDRTRAFTEQKLELEGKALSQRLDQLAAESQADVEKFKAISPEFIGALQAFGTNEMATKLASAISPMALLGGESLADVLTRIFKDTPLAAMVTNLALPKALPEGRPLR